MASWLKQSTNATVQLGPFVDKTTPNTAETAVSVVAECSKAGAGFKARNAAAAIAHNTDGWYRVPLSTIDTNTVGSLIVKSDLANTHLPVWREFFVLPQRIYDVLTTNTAISTLTNSNVLAQANAALTAKNVTAARGLKLDNINNAATINTALSTAHGVGNWAATGGAGSVTNASVQAACNSALTAKGATVAVMGRLDVAVSTRSVVTNASAQAQCNAALTAKGVTAARGAKLDNLDTTVSSRSVVTNASALAQANTALTTKGLTVAGVSALSKVTNTSAQAASNAALTAKGLTVAVASRLDNTVSSRSSATFWTQAKSAYLDAAVSSRSAVTNASVGVQANTALTAKGLTVARVLKIDQVTNGAGVNTALSAVHGAGSWATATGFSQVTNASVQSAANASLAAAGVNTTRMGYLDRAVSTRAPSNTALSTATWTAACALKLDQVDNAATINTVLSTAHGAGNWAATGTAGSGVTNASVQTAANAALTAKGLTVAGVAAFSRVTNASVKTACNTAQRVRKIAAVVYGKTAATTNQVAFKTPSNSTTEVTIVYNATDGGRDTVTVS
jgi:hypothetical protein